MPIRLSGMVSGMDTETLVSALVSGYKLKKDNLVKADKAFMEAGKMEDYEYKYI